MITQTRLPPKFFTYSGFTFGCFIIALFALSACGKKHAVSSEFQPYLDSFYKEASDRGQKITKEVSIQFGETIPGATAQCVLSDARPSMGGNEITVNKVAWEKFGDGYFSVEREIILYHELGHCLLGLDHYEDTYDLCDHTSEEAPHFYKNVPVSLMKKNNYVEPSLYPQLKTYYLDQLFYKTAKFPTSKIRRIKADSQCSQSSDSASRIPIATPLRTINK